VTILKTTFPMVSITLLQESFLLLCYWHEILPRDLYIMYEESGSVMEKN